MAASRIGVAWSGEPEASDASAGRLVSQRPRRFFARRFPGFTLKPTGAFWAFLLAVPLLGVAALNTGNNALYLLLSLAMGAFVASGAFSRHTLSRLRVRLSAPPEVFAGAPVALPLAVTNLSSWLPAATVVCRLEGMPGHVVVGWVPPRGTTKVTLLTMFGRRGRRGLPAVVVEVRLPLNFFVKSVRWTQPDEVLVYPRRVRVGVIRWARLTRRATATSRGRGHRGGEVDQLREFRPGDDTRDIHWKQTARQQRIIVMERRETAVPVRYLALDRQLSRRDSTLLRERFENLVSEVFSSAFAELRRGQPVGLVVGGAVTPPGTGTGHARQVLEQLALVEPVGPGEDPLPALLASDAVYRLAEPR
ncbi:MAG: DUF58 domain-containing protein [Thermoanaerobaculales bacterium]